MAVNRGKQFETLFKRDVSKLPDISVDRLYDQVSGYKTISNISDFIVYSYPNIFYVECKSISGNTFPLTNLTQYSKLLCKVGIKGVRAGVIIWYTEHDKILYVPIKTIQQLKKDKKKSVNINTVVQEHYRVFEIPCEIKRTLPTADYSVLLTLQEGD